MLDRLRDAWDRQPALLINLSASILAVLVALNVHWLTATQMSAFVVLLNAIASAWVAAKVRPLAPAFASGVITAVVGLLAAYQFDIRPDLVAAVQLAVQSAVTLWTWAVVTPIAAPDPNFTPIPE